VVSFRSMFDGCLLFNSLNTTYSPNDYSIRPVVTLPSTVKLQNVPGTMEWEIVEK